MTLTIPQHITQITPPIIDVVKTRAAAWRQRGAEVINLGQAVPSFPPPEIALLAAREALERPETHLYCADAGLISLREALCTALAGTSGLQADPETEVIITAGANQAFMLAILAFLEPGDEVLLPSPYFTNHEMAVRIAKGVPVEVP